MGKRVLQSSGRKRALQSNGVNQKVRGYDVSLTSVPENRGPDHLSGICGDACKTKWVFAKVEWVMCILSMKRGYFRKSHGTLSLLHRHVCMS